MNSIFDGSLVKLPSSIVKIVAVLSAIFAVIVSLSCTVPGTSTISGKGPTLVDQFKSRSDWPHDRSDLAPDDEIVFGRLDNGLRYIVKENQTPKDRVSMHLYIQVGSMYERDDEQGIAHFLEHMLFNGTKHFPPGEMVKYFQRIGMQFGPDANAHTGFNKTVYDVILPDGKKKSLSDGLLVLRDYADGALLSPKETEREKKVILAEMLSRDSANFRTVKATFGFEMPGSIVGQRFPIGRADIIRKIDHNLLRDFYEAWYRPERMFLVVVGDQKKEVTKQLIAEQFSSLTSKKPPRPVPVFGRLNHRGVKGFHHFEKDAGATTVGIESVVQQDEPQDSKAYQEKKLVRELAKFMMQKRLENMVRRQKTVFTSAGMGSGYYLGQLKYTEISGHTNPENWQEAVAEIEQALRDATLHGFTQTEFKRAINEHKETLIKEVMEEGTRDSNDLAREIMENIRDWRVTQSPRQHAESHLPGLEAITLAKVNQAFADIWSADHHLVLVTGNAELSSKSLSPEDQIKNTYLASSKVALEPKAEKQVATFPYLPLPQSSGGIQKREEIKDLGITKVLFENGITLFARATPFKRNQVVAALSFGYGSSSEPPDQPGLAKLTEDVVNESGFGKIDRIELEDALVGRLASTELKIKEDLFSVKGKATTKELPLLFQLLHATVQDPGYREAARQLAVKRFEQESRRMSKSVDGVMRLRGFKFLAGGDNRFGTPELEQFRQRSLDQVKEWMGPQLSNTPMELAIVGDFELDRVIELASQYLGTLPQRDRAKKVPQVSGPEFPRGEELNLSIKSQTPKALVVVAFPTEDFWDIHRTRRLAVMAELYSERLRQNIREKLGAAYSPHAYNQSFRAYKGYGMTQIYVQVDPKQSQSIVTEVRQIAEQLSSQDAESDADEFRRVLDPTLTYIKDLRQKNIYWLDSVLTGAARNPEQLDWARTIVGDYAAIKKDEISKLAQKYLSNGNAATIVLTPEPASP